MNEDSYVIFQNETDFQVAPKTQATLFFQSFFLSLLILRIMKIYFTWNNILLTKTHKYV